MRQIISDSILARVAEVVVVVGLRSTKWRNFKVKVPFCRRSVLVFFSDDDDGEWTDCCGYLSL